MMTLAMVQGLLGNIHRAHQDGAWDSAMHLREIIKQLQDGFVQHANINTIFERK